jgi:hypothetical protein
MDCTPLESLRNRWTEARGQHRFTAVSSVAAILHPQLIALGPTS